MFVSDGLKSLETAVAKVFNSSVHQKCIVHLQWNLLAKVRSTHKQEIADDFKKGEKKYAYPIHNFKFEEKFR